MKEFDYYGPSTLEEALSILSEHQESVAILAGGTDIVLELNEGKINPAIVVNIKKLKELDYIKKEKEILRIGALTSFTSIVNDSFIKEHVKVLYTACSLVGSPQIRNLGTIGGNIASSSVAGDGLCAMCTLEASVVLESKKGTRIMKLVEFLEENGCSNRNALQADELITELFFKIPNEKTKTAFYKLAKRKSLAISVIGGGLLVEVDRKNICKKVVLRGGCLARYPLVFTAAQEHLCGKELTLKNVEEILPMLHDAVYESAKNRPWSVFYKKESVQGVFYKLFEDVIEELK